MFRLKDHFEALRDAECTTLGGQRTAVAGVLAYADTIHHVRLLAENPLVAAIMTTPGLAGSVPERLGVVAADDPRTRFYEFHEERFRCGDYPKIEGRRGSDCEIHASAIIDEHVVLGDRVKAGAGAVIGGNVEIGDDVLIEPGARIGVEGILYLRTARGIRRVRHAGGARIGGGATVLTNAVVVRSVCDSLWTEIGACSIVGIASCVGHEAFVGENCVISGNCVIARNTILEDEVFVGTNSYVRENVHVGSRAKVMAGSVVVSNVAGGATVSGNFAISHEKRLKEFALSHVRKS